MKIPKLDIPVNQNDTSEVPPKSHRVTLPGPAPSSPIWVRWESNQETVIRMDPPYGDRFGK